MICHKTKCIFIHIPRTAGSSIEIAIQGKNQWAVDMTTKHLVASTAKRIYKDYWDDYFKFSFVRNPWSRMVSMCKYGNSHPRKWNQTYGVDISSGKLNLDNYKKIYNRGIEVDPRFKYKEEKYENIIPNAVYLNILNEEIDFVGKFENLERDIEYVSEKIKKNLKLSREEYSGFTKKHHYSYYYTEQSKNDVYDIYKHDIGAYEYKFEDFEFQQETESYACSN